MFGVAALAALTWLLTSEAALAAATDPESPGISVSLNDGPGVTQSVTIIALMTVLSLAPAILMLTTSFTKIVVVLALTRQALGTPTIPPNQVMAGLAIFLSLFVMGPVLTQSYNEGIAPFIDGQITDTSVALENTFAPVRSFMLAHTGQQELQTMIALSGADQPQDETQVSAVTLIPAFVLSELKTAFIIGFVIFIPFLIIDLVVASTLMSMGMMMLPPIMISLPFKLLLFIMVDGWTLITTALVTSYR
nr:flagellar type III secretion system pore protein FliP [Kineosphaera limosa]